MQSSSMGHTLPSCSVSSATAYPSSQYSSFPGQANMPNLSQTLSSAPVSMTTATQPPDSHPSPQPYRCCSLRPCDQCPGRPHPVWGPQACCAFSHPQPPGMGSAGRCGSSTVTRGSQVASCSKVRRGPLGQGCRAGAEADRRPGSAQPEAPEGRWTWSLGRRTTRASPSCTWSGRGSCR